MKHPRTGGPPPGNFNLKMVYLGGASIPFWWGRWGVWGATPRKFWSFNLKLMHFRGSSIPFWGGGVGGGVWEANPRKFWIDLFNLKMVHFGSSSISFWQIKEFATGSKYQLVGANICSAGANNCSDLLQAHLRSKCLGANSEFFAPTLPLDNLATAIPYPLPRR